MSHAGQLTELKAGDLTILACSRKRGVKVLIAIGRRATPDGLVDLLLECHQRIRSFMQIAKAIGSKEGTSAREVIDACEACERYFTQALPLHVADEELSVLPRLRGLRPEVDDALVAMHAQHQEHEPLLRALLQALQTVRGRPDDLEPCARLLNIANELSVELERHLLLEEQLLFPAIRSEMPKDVQARVINELRARREGGLGPVP